MDPSVSRRRRRKPVLRGHLVRRDLAGLCEEARRDRATTSTLIALLLDPDPLIGWRAVEALGWLAAQMHREDPDKVLDLVRRQFWSMTDESGNIPWRAPEVIGEILYRVPALAADFIPNLASYGETYPFSAGVFWALSRLAPSWPRVVADEIGRMVAAVEHRDPAVRGHAAAALGALGAAEGLSALGSLVEDAAEVTRYDFDSGELVRTTVGEIAGAAKRQLTGSSSPK